MFSESRNAMRCRISSVFGAIGMKEASEHVDVPAVVVVLMCGIVPTVLLGGEEGDTMAVGGCTGLWTSGMMEVVMDGESG